MVEVFGVPMIATPKWNTTMLNHVASVLAELIDNNNDGCADDPKVLKELLKKVDGKRKTVLLPNKADDVQTAAPLLEKAGFMVRIVEGLDETVPRCSGLKFTHDCCDASIEELFHFVTEGHSTAHPKIFGADWTSKSSLTNAMDIARYKFFADIFNLLIVVSCISARISTSQNYPNQFS